MKNKIFQIVASILLLAGFTACNEKWEPDTLTSGDTGWLSTNDLSVDLTNAEDIITSRAAVDLSNFIVTVTNENGVVVNEWTYAQMPSLPAFTVGNYTLKIESGASAKAAWEAPYFAGTKDFTIVKDEIVNAGTVKCTLQNLKVSVKFDEQLVAASAGDLECEIRVNEEGVLKFNPTETRSAYFEVVPGNTTMVATFTGTVNGYSEEIIRLYKDLQPGQHRIITFALKGANIDVPVETGTMDPTGGLNVDFWVDDVDLSGNVNTGDEDVISGNRPGGEEWPEKPDEPTPDNPTPDDPVTTDCIKFTSSYLDLSDGNINHAPDFGPGLQEAVVLISAEHKIAKLLVDIDSKGLNETELQSIGLPKTFDLANPGSAELAEALGTLNFKTGSDVMGKTSVEFDITTFVPLLPNFDDPHKFTITVTDQSGHTQSLVLTFVNE